MSGRGWWVIIAVAVAGCASTARVELEPEPSVTKVWVGGQTPPPSGASVDGDVNPTPVTIRSPAPAAPPTTVPRPSSWVRPDPPRR